MTEPDFRTAASRTGRSVLAFDIERGDDGVESRDDNKATSSGHPASRRLSYKFQRLRERIRAAIEAGELVGKLPGERSLARQFNVNAKTLSKALTDLAAEGVLERNIGLGTFVRDANSPAAQARILMLSEGSAGDGLVNALAARGLQAQSHSKTSELPPSMVAPFDLILVASPAVSEQVIRDLIVRGKSVITLNRQTKPYSTNAVLPHAPNTAVNAAKHLASLGHRKMLVVPHPHHDDVHPSISAALPHAETKSVSPEQAVAAAKDGFTAAVCDAAVAPAVLQAVRAAGVAVPTAFSLMAYGRRPLDPTDCCGHYVTDDCVADAVVDLIAAGLPHKPLTLWLAGKHADGGTTAPPASV